MKLPIFKSNHRSSGCLALNRAFSSFYFVSYLFRFRPFLYLFIYFFIFFILDFVFAFTLVLNFPCFFMYCFINFFEWLLCLHTYINIYICVVVAGLIISRGCWNVCLDKSIIYVYGYYAYIYIYMYIQYGYYAYIYTYTFIFGYYIYYLYIYKYIEINR